MQMRSEFRKIIPLLVITGVLTAAMPAYGSQAYQAGIKAFRQGSYEQALEYFRQAEANGLDSPGLVYNLGVTCYMLGNYREAAEQFQRLEDNPDWRHLTLYNLGLVAEAAGDRRAAIDYYSEARDAAGNSKIKQLASLKLRELRTKRPSLHPARQWYAMISAAAGYDDNAVLTDEDFDEISKKSDFFTELHGFGSFYISGNQNDGFRLDAGAFTRLYADETDYSFTSFSGGIIRQKFYTPWHTGFGLRTAAEFVEDELFSMTPALELSAERNFSDIFTLKLANRLSWIEARGRYDYLSGLENRLSAGILRRIKGGRVHTGIGFAYNDRDDLRTEQGEFFSYSPFRTEISAGMDYLVAPKYTLLLYCSYRKSLYPDKNTTEDKKRADDRIIISVRGEYELLENTDLFAEFTRTDNDSNFDGYSYESNRIMLGVQRFF